MKKLYALGMKGWIEIRKASTPPRPRISKAKVNSSRRVPNYDFRPGDSLWREIPATLTLKMVAFTGGKTMKVVKRRRFAALLGSAPKVGEVMEIPTGLAEMSLIDRVMED